MKKKNIIFFLIIFLLIFSLIIYLKNSKEEEISKVEKEAHTTSKVKREVHATHIAHVTHKVI